MNIASSRRSLTSNFSSLVFVFFFFNDTATTEIYTLSLHDALPISRSGDWRRGRRATHLLSGLWRSEEHTSELQSRQYLVCRLLLEKKKKKKQTPFKCKKKNKRSKQKQS